MRNEFLEIISQYQGILHKVNLIYFRSRADREDNFQEIVYQLWKAFPNLKSKESLGSWIYSISISTAIATLRKKSRVESRHTLPDVRDPDSQHEKMAKNESLQLLIEAIRGLGEIDRSIMLLYLEEKSHEEISQILGITKSNVGTKISRIKSALHKKLNSLDYENR